MIGYELYDRADIVRKEKIRSLLIILLIILCALLYFILLPDLVDAKLQNDEIEIKVESGSGICTISDNKETNYTYNASIGKTDYLVLDIKDECQEWAEEDFECDSECLNGNLSVYTGAVDSSIDTYTGNLQDWMEETLLPKQNETQLLKDKLASCQVQLTSAWMNQTLHIQELNLRDDRINTLQFNLYMSLFVALCLGALSALMYLNYRKRI